MNLTTTPRCHLLVLSSSECDTVLDKQNNADISQSVPMASASGRVVDSSLTVHNIQLNDAGRYHCTATTHDDKTGADSVHVRVYGKTVSETLTLL